MNIEFEIVKIIWSWVRNNVWESVLFWRILGIFLSVVLMIFFYLVIKHKQWLVDFLKIDERRRHDEKLFHILNDILNEQKMMDILESVEGEVYFESDWGNLSSLHDFFTYEENKFLNKELVTKSEVLKNELNELLKRLATDFFTPKHSKNIDMYRFRPEQNSDINPLVTQEDEQLFIKKKFELIKRVNNVRNSYTQFRAAIKRVLFL